MHQLNSSNPNHSAQSISFERHKKSNGRKCRGSAVCTGIPHRPPLTRSIWARAALFQLISVGIGNTHTPHSLDRHMEERHKTENDKCTMGKSKISSVKCVAAASQSKHICACRLEVHFSHILPAHWHRRGCGIALPGYSFAEFILSTFFLCVSAFFFGVCGSAVNIQSRNDFCVLVTNHTSVTQSRREWYRLFNQIDIVPIHTQARERRNKEKPVERNRIKCNEMSFLTSVQIT